MQMSDVIADMLTRIRNANNAKHDTVDIPASNMKKAIADILVDEGYIKNVQIIEDNKQGVIRVTLKYGPGKTKILLGLIDEAVKVSNGDIICIEKCMKLTYEVNHKVRLVDAERYNINGYDILKYDSMLLTKSAVETIEEVYA